MSMFSNTTGCHCLLKETLPAGVYVDHFELKSDKVKVQGQQVRQILYLYRKYEEVFRGSHFVFVTLFSSHWPKEKLQIKFHIVHGKPIPD